MIYRVEVIADNSGEWCGNGLKFRSWEDAYDYGLALSVRWTAVREFRIVDDNGKVVSR